MKRKTRKGRKTEMMRMMMAFGFAAIVASSAALAGTNNVDVVEAGGFFSAIVQGRRLLGRYDMTETEKERP